MWYIVRVSELRMLVMGMEFVRVFLIMLRGKGGVGKYD